MIQNLEKERIALIHQQEKEKDQQKLAESA
jgi:hypothetical protein